MQLQTVILYRGVTSGRDMVIEWRDNIRRCMRTEVVRCSVVVTDGFEVGVELHEGDRWKY